MIGRTPSHLFRRHVSNRPHHGSGIRDLFPRGDLRTIDLIALGSQFRQTEVQNLHPAEVLRLEIAVDNSFFVRSSQTLSDLLCIISRFARIEPPVV